MTLISKWARLSELSPSGRFCESMKLKLAGRAGPKPGEIGSGRSGGMVFCPDVTLVGVAPFGLANRSEGSGHQNRGFGLARPCR